MYITKDENAKGNGLLNQKSFMEIQNFERSITGHKNWTSICRAISIADSNCMINADGIPKNKLTKDYFLGPSRALISPVQDSIMFIEQDLGKDFSKVSEEEFQSAFKRLRSNPNFRFIKSSFDKYNSESNNTLSYIRSFINYGLPLNIDGKVYKNSTDRKDEQ